jgi:succinate-semialdehyde dehydrogenase/glutarate-semialdehyde dehydrogenase
MLELNDKSLLKGDAFIAGVWSARQNRFAVTNPSTGAVIGEVADCTAQDAVHAIDAAATAQKEWAKRTALERADVLMALYHAMIENRDDLAAILTAEMGKPLAEATGEITYGAGFIRWFAEEARRSYGDVIPGHQPDKRLFAVKQPVGVVAAITPWNFPNAMITRKLGPALAAGCAMVLKPAAETPYSALTLAMLAERVGVPKGLFSVLPTTNAPAIGEVFCTSETVRKLTFTGSTQTGRTLMAQCASTVKNLGLELGGNAPFIVFDDADLDAAVEGAMTAKYRNNGQTCVCANRIYVQDAVYDAFAEKLVKAVEAMQVGDGFTPGVTLGPLIDTRAVTKVDAHISDAVSNGATVMTGGTRHARGGTFYAPTVLRDATADMLVSTDETFGPVSPLFRFTDTDDVIAAANDTIFGLASYFYANNLSRVWRVAEALEYGMVGVNTGLISTEVAPFGGVKQSGLGTEGARQGLEDYQEVKYICLSV